MPKRLFAFSNNGTLSLVQFDIGQGIKPSLKENPEGSVFGTSGNTPVLFQTASGDLLGAASGGNSGAEGLYFWNDPFDLTTGNKVTTPVFTGVVYAGAASSEFLAIGGGSPFLYVLSRLDLSLKVVSTAGLGNVFAIAFSHDGSMLAVLHAAAPYLRVYKTSDWSFTNVAPAVQMTTPPSVNIKGLAFSLDDTKLIASTGTLTNIYNPLTLGRLTTTATGGAGQVVVSRTKPNEAFLAVSGASSPGAGRINLSTGAFSAVTGSQNLNGTSVAIDENERILYLSQASVSGDIYIRRFDADSLDELPVDRGDLFSVVRQGNAALLIIDTTPHRISGAVRDIGNNPAQREVKAFDRETGRLVARTMSDPVTGNYVLRTDYAGPFDVQFKSLSGELLNDLIYAKVMAEPIA